MNSKTDWKGIVRELRLLVTQLPRDRFYAIYILVLSCLIFLLFK